MIGWCQLPQLCTIEFNASFVSSLPWNLIFGWSWFQKRSTRRRRVGRTLYSQRHPSICLATECNQSPSFQHVCHVGCSASWVPTLCCCHDNHCPLEYRQLIVDVVCTFLRPWSKDPLEVNNRERVSFSSGPHGLQTTSMINEQDTWQWPTMHVVNKPMANDNDEQSTFETKQSRLCWIQDELSSVVVYRLVEEIYFPPNPTRCAHHYRTWRSIV